MSDDYMLLPVMLDDREMADRAGELGDLIEKWRELDAERKDKAAQYKSKLTSLDEQIRQLAHVVSRREEMQDVRIRAVPDYETKTMGIFRDDTGELVSRRPLTAEELQLDLAC